MSVLRRPLAQFSSCCRFVVRVKYECVDGEVCVFFTFAVLCRDAVCDTTVAGSLSRMLFQFNLLKKKSLIALCTN